MDKHTPTPWKLGKAPDGKTTIQATDEIGLHLFEQTFQGSIANANAAFIVRAVNAHQELLDAAKEALEKLELIDQINFDETGEEMPSPETEQLRQAIAKAEAK